MSLDPSVRGAGEEDTGRPRTVAEQVEEMVEKAAPTLAKLIRVATVEEFDLSPEDLARAALSAAGVPEALEEGQQAREDLDGFRDGLTEALNAAGVPAMPSWPGAIDYLVCERDAALEERDRLRAENERLRRATA